MFIDAEVAEWCSSLEMRLEPNHYIPGAYGKLKTNGDS
jgi:hypothetical protein